MNKTMTQIQAKVIADSVNLQGDRITTMVVLFLDIS
jgi:hypothetical protein